MAPRQAHRNIPRVGRQRSVPKDKRARPQGITKVITFRKSARLEEIRQGKGQIVSKIGMIIHFPPQLATLPVKRHVILNPANYAVMLIQVKFPQAKDRKRKLLQEVEATLPSTATPSQKRPRTSPPRFPIQETIGKNTAVGASEKEIDLLEYWRKDFRWPKEYFEPESNMNHLLARKKSSSSLRGKQSEAGSATLSSTTPSDQKPRDAKSTQYSRPSYETILATKGSFMGKFDLGITDASKRLCRALLETEQLVPQDTLFRDDLFDETCESIRARNEAMVVRDIFPLICPSAQVLRIYGAKHLKPLHESVNEGWNSAIPFYGPRPQPDYSVGFGRSAFTNNQLEKLTPFVGEVTDTFASYFMATWQMYLPFLTCEVKCGIAALDIADRQNAHSMTLAVRGIVELFRLVKREKELHREILAFSISHDHETVRIYGHYPVIDENKTTFFRYPIRKFDFTELDGKEKWTAYKFTKNVYDIWMPTHLKRICLIIDDLPSDLNFEVSQQSEQGESGLSQRLESHDLSDYTSHDAESLEEADSQSSRVSSGDITPDTSLSQRIDRKAIKRSKKRSWTVELHQSQDTV